MGATLSKAVVVATLGQTNAILHRRRGATSPNEASALTALDSDTMKQEDSIVPFFRPAAIHDDGQASGYFPPGNGSRTFVNIDALDERIEKVVNQRIADAMTEFVRQAENWGAEFDRKFEDDMHDLYERVEDRLQQQDETIHELHIELLKLKKWKNKLQAKHTNMASAFKDFNLVPVPDQGDGKAAA